MRAIDADALIYELNNSHYPGAPYVDAGISIAIGKVCDAPTIEPERKKGRWLDTIQDGWWQCSNCGAYWQKTIVESCNIIYCPNCGMDMRVGEDA